MSDEVTPNEPEDEDGRVVLSDRRMMTATQLLSYADPMLVMREEVDACRRAVHAEAERQGKAILSEDMTIEIYIRAVAK